MPTYSEQEPFGGFLLDEANGYRSRENIIVAEGQNLSAGAVVGKITTGGKIAVYNNGASDGTQAAVGILLGAVDATDADKKGVIIANDAEVKKTALIYAAGQDAAAQAAAIVDLLALRIKARV